MPTSRAVDQEFERWFHDNTAEVLWPREGFVLFAARLTEVFVRRCQDVLEDWVGPAHDFAAPEPQDDPLAKPLDLPPSSVRRWMIQWLEDFSFDLLICDGSTYIDYDYAISLVLHPVRETLYAMALQRGKTHNALMPRKLPPEVLCAILEYVSFHDLISATKVCWLWRERARAAPRLWCNLELSAPLAASSARLAQNFISLSNAHPLSLVVRNIRPVHVERDLCEPLACNLSRMRRLELHLDAENQECVKLLYALLHDSPAPRLEKFVLQLPERSRTVLVLSPQIFQGIAPRLTDLTLPSCVLPVPWKWQHARTFSSVRTLTTRYARGPEDRTERALQFCHLLLAFPHVSALTLGGVHAGAMLPLLYPDTSVRSLTLRARASAPDGTLPALLSPTPAQRAEGHQRDHMRVRALTLAFAGVLPGSAVIEATRGLPAWTHVAAGRRGDALRLSVWCGTQRVRHFEFRSAREDVVSVVENDALFARAYVDADWDSADGLGGCKEEVFGVDVVRALRRRFGGLLVGIRPAIL